MGDPTTAQRKLFAKMGLAMPDGSYYIRNGDVGASDLQNAIDSVGRGENAGDSGAAIRKFIIKRAFALKLSSKIPATWNPDGSLKHGEDDPVDTFIEHFGVHGMRWGVRKSGTIKASVPANSSVDHQHVALIKAKIKQSGGIHSLSTDELKAVNDRLTAEANFHRLNPQTGALDKGRTFAKTAISDVKTVLDAVETGKRVVNLAQDAKPSAPASKGKHSSNA